ncbi:N-acetylglucosamine-6-phosphate deacetylase [Alkalibaculum sp. M08DMB]|uniref:N-acetylglucosamine-6-phosphate deacetylase n=1 Tax=Alkalibaculum sporogenes TaxID=2655001 RepID=A0A6A7K7Z0_9FIRM|nr:N-acetylglucosamine-6-phosphate deacetylase [Alkalibaculum sporogenes]MPW25609.1 N-acetylglucosamine-6-phosphate deacetylase [Alkalibaculum sporogenes]
MNAIINGKIIIGNTLVNDRVLIFKDKIIDIIPKNEISKYAIQYFYDAQGHYVSPGFIDIHTHGAMGHDFMDGEGEGIKVIAKSFATHGVTGFLPTTMTMDIGTIEKSLYNIQKSLVSGGSKILGCHLEGPFISPLNAGAQNTSFIQKPDFQLLENFKELIKLVTIAPELADAEDFIRKCINYDIVVAIGHSCGTYEDAINAIRIGARSISHTFNAMTPLNHRKPGIVGAAMDRDEVFCELIADNIHVHPAIQRILLQIKGIEKVILVTDSMRACGMENGVYDLGGQKVVVEKNSARLENGTLAGSILSINNALKNFKTNTGISIVEAVKTVTENPAKLLKMGDTIGSIRIGNNSDFVIHDEEFSILFTFINGKLVYRSGNL